MFFLYDISCFAQKEFNDSLKNRIENEKDIDEKVRLNLQVGIRLANSDTAEARKYHVEILRIANETGSEFYLGQAHLLSGSINLKNPARAIVDYEKALRIFEKFPDRKYIWNSIAPTLLNLGLAHSNAVDYDASIGYYLRAEEVYLENSPDHPELAILYTNLSITYGTINRYDDALKFSKKGFDRARKGKDEFRKMVAYYAHGGNLSMQSVMAIMVYNCWIRPGRSQ
jgi:two-component system NarL family sensor kinase